MRAVSLAVSCLLLAGCATSPRFLWEEYTSTGIAAARAGQHARAEGFLNRAAQKAEELGPQERGRSLNNLAELYRRQGRMPEAEDFFKRALAVKEAGLGLDHPDVAYSLNNLATLYLGLGRELEATPLLERSLVIQEKALDPEHPALARTLTTLAEVYRRLGRDHDAFLLEVRLRMLRAAPPPER